MDSAQVIRRFEAERQALALLDHPNVAHVYDAGTTEAGRPYFVMEYVKGVPITEHCDRQRLTIEERLRLFVKVCEAIQHAHQKGIIHRDIKPSNIQVCIQGEQAVPKVIDFGVAKALSQPLTERTLVTEQGQLIGTPEYISPEQAEMTNQDIDTRSDIYSLGVVLYELLTGTLPFEPATLRKGSLEQMRQVIREAEPKTPSTRVSSLNAEASTKLAKCCQSDADSLRRKLRGDLDWIILKAMEKDRIRRYQTAHALAEDIERHLNNEPVLAGRPGTLYRFQKLVRRNKGVFAAIAVVAATLVIGLTVSAVSLVREQHARRIAVAAQEKEAMLRQQAQANELAMRQIAYASDMSLVQLALRWNNLGRAWVLLDRNRPKAEEKDLRGWEWRYLWQACRSDHAFELPSQGYSLYAVDLSPDGRLLATSDFSGCVNLWDFARREVILSLSAEGPMRTPVCFSPSGRLLAMGAARNDNNGFAQVWDVETRQPVVELPHTSFVVSLAFTPDEKRLVTWERGGSDQNVLVWDLERKQAVFRFPVTEFGGTHHGVVAVSPDGRLLAIGGPHEVRGIDLVRGETNMMFTPLTEGVTSLAFSPDSRQLAVGTGYLDGTVRLFDAASGKPIGQLPGHLTGVLGLRFSKDGKRLVSVSGDQSLRVWDVENWNVEKQRELLILRGHMSEVFCLALTPDDQTAITGCKDGTLFGWDLRLEAHIRPSIILPHLIKSVEFSADSRFMFSVNTDGSASVWTTSPIREVGPLSDAGTKVRRVLPSTDGKYLVVGTTEGQMKVIDAATQREIYDLPGHKAPVVPVGFAREGRTLITVDNEGVIMQWDTASWSIQKSSTTQDIGGVMARVTVLSDAPNTGFLLLAPSARKWSGWVSWWNLAQGTDQRRIHAHISQDIGQLAVSPDGQILATTASDTYVKLWSVATGDQWKPSTLRGNLLSMHAVVFSPDGTRLATGGNGKEAVKLWDLTTGQEVVTLEGTGMLFAFARFSPDGNLIAATNVYGQAHLWRAPSWAEIEAAEKKLESGQSP